MKIIFAMKTFLNFIFLELKKLYFSFGVINVTTAVILLALMNSFDNKGHYFLLLFSFIVFLMFCLTQDKFCSKTRGIYLIFLGIASYFAFFTQVVPVYEGFLIFHFSFFLTNLENLLKGSNMVFGYRVLGVFLPYFVFVTVYYFLSGGLIEEKSIFAFQSQVSACMGNEDSKGIGFRIALQLEEAGLDLTLVKDYYCCRNATIAAGAFTLASHLSATKQIKIFVKALPKNFPKTLISVLPKTQLIAVGVLWGFGVKYTGLFLEPLVIEQAKDFAKFVKSLDSSRDYVPENVPQVKTETSLPDITVPDVVSVAQSEFSASTEHAQKELEGTQKPTAPAPSNSNSEDLKGLGAKKSPVSFVDLRTVGETDSTSEPDYVPKIEAEDLTTRKAPTK